MQNLAGKTAIVTGASSGIGRALALRWATAGMNVVVGDIDEPALDATIDDLRRIGSAAGQRCDVTDESDVRGLLDLAIEEFGRAHLVCNNAGVAGPTGVSPHDFSLNDWRWVLEVDLYGLVHGARVFTPHLIEYGDGHIVNTASQSGLTSGAIIGAPYYAAKHAAVALSECQFHDLKITAPGVSVSVLCPGAVATRIMEGERLRPERFANASGDELAARASAATAAMREVIDAGRSPEEVADLVHDAVVADEFYIYTDPAIIDAVAQRHRAIEQRADPPSGRMDADVLGN